ncbi:restriction endonuclease subunit S [bacterium]|nr:restriction endonuclease subunit S [bacterium]
MKWQKKRLDDIALLDRRSILPSNTAISTPYIGLEHLDSEGNITCTETVESADLKSNKFLFSGRHILFGKLRPYLRKIVRPDFEGICSTDIIPILPGDDVSRDYLFYFLRTPEMVSLATNRSSGANLPRLSPKQLASFKIPLPPLEEQKRIAGILDAADGLRTKRRESLALLDTLPQATFLDMFGDPVTNPMGWDTVEVGDEIHFLTSGSRGWAKYYSDNGDIFIRIQNLKNGRLDLSDIAFVQAPESAESKRTKVEPGDVLLSITADLGRTAVVPDNIRKAHINQHIAILRFSQLNPVFVSYQLATKGGQAQFTRLNREGVKAGLNFNDVKRIKLTKPPFDLQCRFSASVKSVERLKQSYGNHLTELNSLFESLQHRAFTGEL